MVIDYCYIVLEYVIIYPVIDVMLSIYMVIDGKLIMVKWLKQTLYI